MQMIAEETSTSTSTEQKTRELCQAIIDRPDFPELRRKMDAFMNDESAKFQYQMLNERGQMLQSKQQQGLPLTDEEIAQFEALRDTFTQNTVATGFLDAQQEIQKIHDAVNQHLSKTFELGRVPTAEDFSSGCCSSSGCGCH